MHLDWIEQGLTSNSTHYRSFRRWWGDCGIGQDCSCSQSPRCVRCWVVCVQPLLITVVCVYYLKGIVSVSMACTYHSAVYSPDASSNINLILLAFFFVANVECGLYSWNKQKQQSKCYTRPSPVQKMFCDQTEVMLDRRGPGPLPEPVLTLDESLLFWPVIYGWCCYICLCVAAAV